MNVILPREKVPEFSCQLRMRGNVWELRVRNRVLICRDPARLVDRWIEILRELRLERQGGIAS